jgi:thioredoxin reductase (NADPH)
MIEQKQKVDVLIIGSGPAGLTAGIYSAWVGLKTIILESGIIGGRAWLAPKIENFPGFDEGIKGSALMDKMSQQAIHLGAEIRPSQEVVNMDLKSNPKVISTQTTVYEALTVIIATGTQRKKLRVPGEEKYIGRGVSYCAICDGPFFKKAKVAVIGNSEEAFSEAVYLADLASEVIVVTQNLEKEVDKKLLNRLQDKPNIEIINGKMIAIQGNHVVEKIKIEKKEKEKNFEREVKGIFVALGGVPMTEMTKEAGIDLDQSGCLLVNRRQKTNITGVFAAGDCTCGGMQIVTAAGEGAMAAMSALAYLRR